LSADGQIHQDRAVRSDLALRSEPPATSQGFPSRQHKERAAAAEALEAVKVRPPSAADIDSMLPAAPTV